MDRAELTSELAKEGLARRLQDAGMTIVRRSDLDEDGLQHVTLEYGSAEDIVRIAVEFILGEWLSAHIDRRLGQLHPYLNDDEREYIGLLTYHGLHKAEQDVDGWSIQTWADELTGVLRELLGRTPLLHVDGIVRFCMKHMLAVVDSTISDMVEHFLADREYEEFVSMLRYMLDAQPPSMQVLHVFCTNDRVWICDVSGALVRDGEVCSAALQASDGALVNPEDLAMSILITRSPCKIVIHDLTVAAPWPSFAETLERVFLDRATRCGECSTCQELQRANQPATDGSCTRCAMPDQYE
ncbi:MAG: putative sporulation protein YtxC [Alicyclobacillus sp.]|nr:putative sporulation protein YtxC [Alicyclobacillus sp.]